jgi:chromate transport protein ChrA
MTAMAQSELLHRLGRVGVALAVLATIVAGVFPGGALLIGLSFAYIVWGDNPRLKRQFSMLAGIVTIVWAAMYGLPASGLFDHVSTSVGTPHQVSAPASP